jgi:hypothetical protein
VAVLGRETAPPPPLRETTYPFTALEPGSLGAAQERVISGSTGSGVAETEVGAPGAPAGGAPSQPLVAID